MYVKVSEVVGSDRCLLTWKTEPWGTLKQQHPPVRHVLNLNQAAGLNCLLWLWWSLHTKLENEWRTVRLLRRKMWHLVWGLESNAESWKSNWADNLDPVSVAVQGEELCRPQQMVRCLKCPDRANSQTSTWMSEIVDFGNGSRRRNLTVMSDHLPHKP